VTAKSDPFDGGVVARGLWNWIHDCVSGDPERFYRDTGTDSSGGLINGPFWESALTFIEGQYPDSGDKYRARMSLIRYLHQHEFTSTALAR
jgi:hypothetical protein